MRLAGKAVSELPFLGPKEDMWAVLVHKLRVWTPLNQEDDDEDDANIQFIRPYLILVVSVRVYRPSSCGSDFVQLSIANSLAYARWATISSSARHPRTRGCALNPRLHLACRAQNTSRQV